MGRDERDGPREIMDNALAEMAEEAGGTLGPPRANLAAFRGKTGPARPEARTPEKKGFKVTPHGRCGTRARVTVPAGLADTTGELLRGGAANSSACPGRIRERGYEGGPATVRDHVAGHRYLVPARRRSAAVPQGSRGRRSRTRPGEAYQAGWGFADAGDWLGGACRIACLALACRHCGTSYVGLFPNARQENPSVGMARALVPVGVPEWVSADDMKSVAARTATPYGSATTPPSWSSSASGPGSASRVTPSRRARSYTPHDFIRTFWPSRRPRARARPQHADSHMLIVRTCA